MNQSLNKQIHMLLTNTGLKEQKANLVLGFSHGRSESSKDLTDGEAIEMVNYLRRQEGAKNDEGNKMRRKIISMAHEMHWHTSTGSAGQGTQKIDMERLNAWCEKYSYKKKKLNDYTYNELPALVSQFTKVYKDFIDKI